MSVHIHSTPDALARTVAGELARAFSAAVDARGRAVFLPSAGRTPVPVYRALRERHADTLDWSRVTLLQMDEYTTVPPGEPRFADQLRRELAEPLGMDALWMWDGHRLPEPAEHADAVARLGRIDVALHGIGRNGHIGFNEPGAGDAGTVARVALAPATRRDTGWATPPRHGLTLGLEVLRRARASWLIATGRAKRDAVADLLARESENLSPATALHGCETFRIHADRAAVGLTPKLALAAELL